MNPRPKAYESSALPLSYSGHKSLPDFKNPINPSLPRRATSYHNGEQLQANAESAQVMGAFHFFGSLTLRIEGSRRVAVGRAGIEETSARCAEVFPRPGGLHRQPGTKIGLSA